MAQRQEDGAADVRDNEAYQAELAGVKPNIFVLADYGYADTPHHRHIAGDDRADA